jgi:hypothetical protein
MTRPMHLYPSVRPGLTAGAYRLRTSQRMSGPTLGDRAVDDRTQHLQVTAPRTTMAPDEVFSVTPPPHAQGPFEARLPHIALKRRTLPWDRSVGAGGAPWLALVMLAEGEGTFRRGEAAVDCYTAGVAATLAGLDTDERGDCIEVTQTVLDRTFPARDEVDLLCHVREADASDTELADDDHWVSVVLCNRLPVAGTAYRCMLVSLEGQHASLPATGGAVDTPSRVVAWEGVLDLVEIPRVGRIVGDGFSVVSATVDSTRLTGAFATEVSGVGGTAATATTASAASTAATIGTEGGFVRLDVDGARLDALLAAIGRVERRYRFPVLATWEFECSDVPGDFGGLMARLQVALFADPGAPEPDHRRPLPVTTATGHVAMAHTDRRGHAGTSWYRGPCTPVKVSRDAAGAPHHVADQARRVGPEGREDLSLASAFEVGRLLAMSDTQFLASLRRWARRGFAIRRTRSLLDDLVSIRPDLLDHRLLDIGRLLAIDILTPGGIGGDPRALLGDPLPIHPDGPLVQPADIDVLATGFGIAKATVAQLAGVAINDRPIGTTPVDVGVVTVDDALGTIDRLRTHLDGAFLERVGQVVDLERRLTDGDDLGLLGGLLDRRP